MKQNSILTLAFVLIFTLFGISQDCEIISVGVVAETDIGNGICAYELSINYNIIAGDQAAQIQINI